MPASTTSSGTMALTFLKPLALVMEATNGSFDIFSRNAYSVTRHPISLTVHRPITAEDRQSKPTRILMQEVFDVIHSDLEEKYK